MNIVFSGEFLRRLRQLHVRPARIRHRRADAQRRLNVLKRHITRRRILPRRQGNASGGDFFDRRIDVSLSGKTIDDLIQCLGNGFERDEIDFPGSVAKQSLSLRFVNEMTRMTHDLNCRGDDLLLRTAIIGCRGNATNSKKSESIGRVTCRDSSIVLISLTRRLLEWNIYDVYQY